MTHSVDMDIILNSFEDSIEIMNSLFNEPTGIDCFYLKKKSKKWVEGKDGVQPFLIFPENKKDIDEEDKKYHIYVCSGSHVGIEDTEYMLHMWMFWFMLKQNIDSLGIDYRYKISEDSEENEYQLDEVWNLILKESDELQNATGCFK